MKFGRKINNDLYNEWREYYLDYDSLKRVLKRRTTSHNWNNEDEAEFTSLLEQELDKIHDFQKSKTTELARRIQNAEQDVHHLVKDEEEYQSAMLRLTNGTGRENTVVPTPNLDVESQQRHASTLDGGDSDDDLDSDDDEDAMPDDSNSGGGSDAIDERFRWLEEEVATLVADVHDLALYTKLNLTGFMKILKVH